MITNLFHKTVAFYRNDPIRFWFRVGMGWRILYGGMRIVLAIFLFRFVHESLFDVWHIVIGHEFLEDPNDLMIRWMGGALSHVKNFPLSPFLPAYLIFWGIVDIALSVALILEKRWAFLAGGVLIGLFLVYEVHRFLYTHSPFLLAVICTDAILLWLIRGEYKRHFRIRMRTRS